MEEYLKGANDAWELAHLAMKMVLPRSYLEAVERMGKLQVVEPCAPDIETAYWITVTDDDGHYCKCSNCGSTATPGPNYWDNRTPYCPFCGMIMDNPDPAYDEED